MPIAGRNKNRTGQNRFDNVLIRSIEIFNADFTLAVFNGKNTVKRIVSTLQFCDHFRRCKRIKRNALHHCFCFHFGKHFTHSLNRYKRRLCRIGKKRFLRICVFSRLAHVITSFCGTVCIVNNWGCVTQILNVKKEKI